MLLVNSQLVMISFAVAHPDQEQSEWCPVPSAGVWDLKTDREPEQLFSCLFRTGSTHQRAFSSVSADKRPKRAAQAANGVFGHDHH
jgi:hypothetical protein